MGISSIYDYFVGIFFEWSTWMLIRAVRWWDGTHYKIYFLTGHTILSH